MKSAKETARKLGRGWQACVWENLGWHWCVDFLAGRYWLSVRELGREWSCMISPVRGTGLPGYYSDEYYSTPKKAVEASVKVFRDNLIYLSEAYHVMKAFSHDSGRPEKS